MTNEAVYLLTGSNAGDRQLFLRQARNILNSRAGKIVFFSHCYESEPWGYESKNAFLNQVLLLNTTLDPEDLFDILLDIEASAGRERSPGGYTDRTLDIDILFFGSKVLRTSRLIIPHPRLHLRRFTLAPLCEIAPYFIHPVIGKSIIDIYERCEDHSEVRQL